MYPRPVKIFPKLVFEKETTFKNNEGSSRVYRLDWSGHSGDLPLEYREWSDNLLFVISDDYYNEIQRCMRRFNEEWAMRRRFDTSVRETCLNPAIEFAFTAFYLLCDCLYDEEKNYFLRDSRKIIAHNILAYRFWWTQTGEGCVRYHAKLDEMEHRVDSMRRGPMCDWENEHHEERVKFLEAIQDFETFARNQRDYFEHGFNKTSEPNKNKYCWVGVVLPDGTEVRKNIEIDEQLQFKFLKAARKANSGAKKLVHFYVGSNIYGAIIDQLLEEDKKMQFVGERGNIYIHRLPVLSDNIDPDEIKVGFTSIPMEEVKYMVRNAPMKEYEDSLDRESTYMQIGKTIGAKTVGTTYCINGDTYQCENKPKSPILKKIDKGDEGSTEPMEVHPSLIAGLFQRLKEEIDKGETPWAIEVGENIWSQLWDDEDGDVPLELEITAFGYPVKCDRETSDPFKIQIFCEKGVNDGQRKEAEKEV